MPNQFDFDCRGKRIAVDSSKGFSRTRAEIIQKYGTQVAAAFTKAWEQKHGTVSPWLNKKKIPKPTA